MGKIPAIRRDMFPLRRRSRRWRFLRSLNGLALPAELLIQRREIPLLVGLSQCRFAEGGGEAGLPQAPEQLIGLFVGQPAEDQQRFGGRNKSLPDVCCIRTGKTGQLSERAAKFLFIYLPEPQAGSSADLA